jgi:hypothetical protein
MSHEASVLFPLQWQKEQYKSLGADTGFVLLIARIEYLGFLFISKALQVFFLYNSKGGRHFGVDF